MIIRPGMHIVLLMGGFGSEREISIKSGENCIEALKENDLKVTKLDLNQSTITELISLKPDICFNCLHGKYGEDGSITPMPGSNLPLATLGTFLLWFGWFGFNGGSQLAMGTAADVAAISNIYINTNLAAAGGVVVAIILTMLFYKKTDLTMALNGALGGLVAITAEPLAPTPMLAISIGAVGGLIVVLTIPLLDKLKIDDVVGAIPVHLFAGIWGTIAVVFSNSDATIGAQLYGITAIGAFTIIASAILWYIIKITMGIRAVSYTHLTLPTIYSV